METIIKNGSSTVLEQEFWTKVQNGELKRHHTSLRRGYVRVKDDNKIEAYKGVFGEGYILSTANLRSGYYKSTNYYPITYYIKEE